MLEFIFFSPSTGWANETPTTSLRVPREFNDYHHHQVQHQQQHHHSHHHQNHHYSVAASTSRDFESSSSSSGSPHHHHHQNNYHQQPHSSSSYYSSSSGSNNHYYSHHIGNNRHLDSALASSSLLYSPHRCYVCLPPNKNSREAQQVLAMVANELRPLIPDCSAFDPYVDAGRFEFDCPPKFGGCILRIHGKANYVLSPFLLSKLFSSFVHQMDILKKYSIKFMGNLSII